MAKRKSTSAHGAITKAATKVAKKVIRGSGKKNAKTPLWLTAVALLLCLVFYLYGDLLLEKYSEPANEGSQTSAAPPHEEALEHDSQELTGVAVALHPGTYAVKWVVDGDTIVLNGETLGIKENPKVRFLGVDTPETVKRNHPVEPFGPEASAYTKRRIAENGNVVRLEFDREKKDKYGRFLAYVWLGDSLLNEELIRHGLGRYLSSFSYTWAMKERFQRAELAAKREKLGIWSPK